MASFHRMDERSNEVEASRLAAQPPAPVAVSHESVLWVRAGMAVLRVVPQTPESLARSGEFEELVLPEMSACRVAIQTTESAAAPGRFAKSAVAANRCPVSLSRIAVTVWRSRSEFDPRLSQNSG